MSQGEGNVAQPPNKAEGNLGSGNEEICLSYPSMGMQRTTSGTVSCHKEIRKQTFQVYVNGQIIMADVEHEVLVCEISD